MPSRQFIEDTVQRLERMRNRPLQEEERGDIEVWQKGRALAAIVTSFGWEVVLEMLQSYVTDQVQKLLTTDPVNADEVKAAHAVAFAANRIYNVFIQDVHNAVEESRKSPDIFKETVRKSGHWDNPVEIIRQAADESQP